MIYEGDKFIEFVNNRFNWQNSNYILTKPFGKSSRDSYIEKLNNKLLWTSEKDSVIYNINSMGYRSDEFIENRQMVFSGCSQTFGVGVLNDGVWGNVLSKRLKIDPYNLGLGGKSVQFTVQNLISFFKEYGNPKFLFCLFPEFTRIEMKSDVSFMKSKYIIEKEGFKTYSILPSIETPNRHIVYSKKPHIAEDIIPSELFFSINLDYIRMLEIYCELKDITFRWGTWDRAQDKYLNKNIKDMDFKNYVYLEMDKWHGPVFLKNNRQSLQGIEYDDYIPHFHESGLNCYGKKPCPSNTKCHEDLRDFYGKNFDIPMDMDVKNMDFGHMPIHKHIHIADCFERSIRNDSN
jgi:hypothetical protein